MPQTKFKVHINRIVQTNKADQEGGTNVEICMRGQTHTEWTVYCMILQYCDCNRPHFSVAKWGRCKMQMFFKLLLTKGKSDTRFAPGRRMNR